MISKRRFSRSLVAVVAACVAAGVFSTHPLAQTRAFAWKVTRGAGVVYLVGSVHMLTSDFYPLAPSLDAAFKDSDHLVEEAVHPLRRPAFAWRVGHRQHRRRRRDLDHHRVAAIVVVGVRHPCAQLLLRLRARRLGLLVSRDRR